MSNTTSINSELFAPLVAAAQYAAYENSVARQIVSVFDMPVNAGKVVQVPRWASISAANPGEGNVATFSDTNTTSVNITLGEHVVAHRVTDMLRDSAFGDVLSQLGDQSGRAIAESMDSEVFSLFTNFDEIGPGANVAVGVSHIMKAAATLRARKLTGPFIAVLNPKQAYALKRELALNGGSNIPALSNVGEGVIMEGYIGTVAGVSVYESGLVGVDVNGDAIGAVFSPMAIGHSMRGTIALETQRQAAYRATDVVLTAVAGANIIESSYGLKITSDATFM